MEKSKNETKQPPKLKIKDLTVIQDVKGGSKGNKKQVLTGPIDVDPIPPTDES